MQHTTIKYLPCIHILAFQMQHATIKYLSRQILITMIYQITALPKENCHQKG